MDFDTKLTSFYVIKTFSRANVHKSIKYGVWCSTASVNSTLNLAFQAGHRVILLFRLNSVYGLFFGNIVYSIAGSKEFCGIAEMTSSVLFDVRFMLWEKLKYDGLFQVKWHSIRNVANFKLKHVIYDGRPIVNSRDGVFIDMQQVISIKYCMQITFGRVNCLSNVFKRLSR